MTSKGAVNAVVVIGGITEEIGLAPNKAVVIGKVHIDNTN